MNTQRGRAPPEYKRQAKQKNKNKTNEQTRTELTTKNSLATDQDKQDIFHKTENHTKPNQTTPSQY